MLVMNDVVLSFVGIVWFCLKRDWSEMNDVVLSWLASFSSVSKETGVIRMNIEANTVVEFPHVDAEVLGLARFSELSSG